jgi:hypothetical protein
MLVATLAYGTVSVLIVMLGFSCWKAAITSSKAFFSVSPDQLTNVRVAFAPPAVPDEAAEGASPPVRPVRPAHELNAPAAATLSPACRS